MACYWPIPALQMGSEAPRLWPPVGSANLELPCGKCIGCRSAKATTWANRCGHEASLWEHNTFLTLTYDDDALPPEGHLRPRDLQLFLKRIRKHANSRGSTLNGDRRRSIRFFACGEYGEENQRPHYHALLFNAGFSDGKRVGTDRYESAELARLWPHGKSEFGQATPAAANYIAQYNLKKQGSGDFNPETGEWRPPPFLRMSLRPGIGHDWVRKYEKDLQHGYLVENGRKQGIPRFYQQKLEPMFLEQLKANAAKHRSQHPSEDNQPERRRAAEAIHKRRKELNEQRSL